MTDETKNLTPGLDDEQASPVQQLDQPEPPEARPVTEPGIDVDSFDWSRDGARLAVMAQREPANLESAQIALSYVEAHADELGIDPERLKGGRYHVHVPAGAIPKDGPSAGVTMLTALVSLLSDRKVKDTVGMTGEITLQGKVLPIGGVKQKVLAAHRAGLTEVVLPARNEADLDDLPDEVREAMRPYDPDEKAHMSNRASESMRANTSRHRLTFSR